MPKGKKHSRISPGDTQSKGPSATHLIGDEGNSRSEPRSDNRSSQPQSPSQSSPPMESTKNPVPQLDRRSKSNLPRPLQPRPIQPRSPPPPNPYLRSYFDNPGRGVEVNLFPTQYLPPADDIRSASPDDQTSNPRTSPAAQTPTLEPPTDIFESGPAQVSALEHEVVAGPQSYFGKPADYRPEELSAWTSGELALRASPPRPDQVSQRITCLMDPPCAAQIPTFLCTACRTHRYEQEVSLLDAEYSRNIAERAAKMVDTRYSTPDRESYRKAHDQIIVTRDAHLAHVKTNYIVDTPENDNSVDDAQEEDISGDDVSEDDMSEDDGSEYDTQEDDMSEKDIQEDEVSEDDISEDNISDDDISEDDILDDSLLDQE